MKMNLLRFCFRSRLVGSAPQLVMKGIVEDMYGTSTALTFASWMAINVPAMLVNVLFIWAWFQFVLGGFKRFSIRSERRSSEIYGSHPTVS